MIYQRKNLKKIEDKQLTTDFINHHRKQQEFFGGKRPTHHKKQSTYSESSSGETEYEYFIPKKEKSNK